MILYFLLPISNSISTNNSFLFIVFIICVLDTFLKGLSYKAKLIASINVLLPEPFSPITRVLLDLFSFNSVKTLPVERRFFHFTDLKYIIYEAQLTKLCLLPFLTNST